MYLWPYIYMYLFYIYDCYCFLTGGSVFRKSADVPVS